ncbi:flavohemoglobin expression-modulating QEGLA motif protein [Candidatus Sumerlaeota bacterium]|nr:flavohemoglobin expression-modulating QEGLA motif protein [Candidatus Sumerlaeota bacterium]
MKIGKAPAREMIGDELIEGVLTTLRREQPVRCDLPGGGRLHVDRHLPFLCVHRTAASHPEPGTDQLIQGEAAHLVASGGRGIHTGLSRLAEGIARMMAGEMGDFLILEIWSNPELGAGQSNSDVTLSQPVFQIITPPAMAVTEAADTLEKQLRRIRIHRRSARVERLTSWQSHPPHLTPLIPRRVAEQIPCHSLGLALSPIHLNPATGEVFPLVLRRMRRLLSRALRRSFHAFALARTSHTPVSYQALGRRRVAQAVWDIDGRLAQIAEAFDFLLQVTPVNIEDALRVFRASRYSRAPAFHYRPIPFDPALMKRRLFSIPLERIEDPALEQLFREKQMELDRQLTMLLDRGRWQFRHGSEQIYGGVSDVLHSEAKELIRRTPMRTRDDAHGGHLDAEAFAALAREEIARQRAVLPTMTSTVQVRDDIYAGLMVSRGNLLIGRSARIPARRAEALLQHEVGTHVLTHANGSAQPLRLLALGLAGYEELQEGLAVLAEYLVGGLSRPRLRLLAGRVVAVRMMLDGADFVETFLALDRDWEFDQKTAFTVTARVYRGGGLTKDAIYLRGLIGILSHLASGGSLDELHVGKMALHHRAIIRELRDRRVLREPPLRPRHLDAPGAQERLRLLSRGLTIFDLLKER